MGDPKVVMASDRDRYILIWLAWSEEMRPRTLTAIRREIEDQVQGSRENVEIDVWLESPGGDANTAYKLALMLRDVACHIRVIVPDYAKSAATLLALAGNEIYLAPGAELGPLDAQMPEEGSIEGAISALSIAHAADAVAQDAVDLAGAGGALLLQQTGLSRAETLNAMLHFSAEFSEPLVRQLNPALVHRAKELLRVTARYATRLLERTANGKARHIAQELVENFPTHGFVIDRVEAEKLDLPVKRLDDYDLLPLLRPLHRAAEDDDYPLIEFVSLKSLLDGLQRNRTEDEPTTTEEKGTSNEQGEQAGAAPKSRRSSAKRKRKPAKRKQKR
jgi:Serine dehydrogenase proteinase